ncbi:MAG: YqaJ viral recombinase family protein [Proteobacteria bacterium]|nr:YqaJ viral recombinase family protein [Pseudomonadota bacterium]
MIIHDLKQGSDEWLQKRAGMPTTSNFSNLVTSTGALSKSIDKYATTLAADLYANKDLSEFQGNHYTDRGIELEPHARRFYQLQREVDVEEVGFITDDEEIWGCSPDGLIGDDGMLEIKCMIPTNHIPAIIDWRTKQKMPVKYIQQIQGQMLICNRSYCDLLLYHPDLPSEIIRILPDEAVVNGLNEAKRIVLEKRDNILKILRRGE